MEILKTGLFLLICGISIPIIVIAFIVYGIGRMLGLGLYESLKGLFNNKKGNKEERTQEVRKGIEASLEGMEKRVVDLGQGHSPGGNHIAVDSIPSENRPLRRRRLGSVEGSE